MDTKVEEGEDVKEQRKKVKWQAGGNSVDITDPDYDLEAMGVEATSHKGPGQSLCPSASRQTRYVQQYLEGEMHVSALQPCVCLLTHTVI
jgi:hypothetical protein